MAFRRRRRTTTTRRRRITRRRTFRRRRTVNPGRLVRAPHYFRVVVASKDFGSSAGTAASGGSFSFSNVGMTTLTTLAAQTTFYYAFSLYFSLSVLPNASQYLSLFDRYNLQRCTVKFYPVNNMVTASDTANPANSQFGGFLHWITDYDDADIPNASDIGVDELRQRTSYRMMNIHRSTVLSRSVRPRIAVGAYSGAFTSFANRAPGWVDSNSPAVQHYGIKGVFEMVNPSATISYQNFKCEITYHFRCKDPI